MGQAVETLSVHCACGKKLKAPASAVGRKAKCPACGNVLTIEAPPPPPPAEDDPMGAIYDLAAAEQAAAESNQIDDSSRCPKCGASMAVGSVLCVNCGYDMRSKAKVAAAAPSKPVIAYESSRDPAGKKKPRDRMAPQGSFVNGLLVSVGLGAVGALIWFLVTYFTDYDISIVCTLIGILAGVGMQIGQKGFSTAGGYVAAGVTFVLLMLARLAVVLVVLIPMIRAKIASRPAFSSGGSSMSSSSGNASSSSSNVVSADEMDGDDREELAEDLSDDQLRLLKIDPETASDAQRAIADKTAERKLATMSPTQQAAALTRYRDKEAQAAASGAPHTPHGGALANGAASGSAAASASGTSSSSAPSKPRPNLSSALGALVFILVFFSWKSAIFMVLSMWAAYRAASGGIRD